MKYILTIAAVVLGMCSLRADVIVIVHRTQTNVNANGTCGSVGGIDIPTYLPDGQLVQVDRTISCWDPGATVCPGPNLDKPRNQDGSDRLPTGVSDKINEMLADAQQSIDNGTPNGNDNTQVWIYNAQGVVIEKYSISLDWTDNGEGESTFTGTIHKIEDLPNVEG